MNYSVMIPGFEGRKIEVQSGGMFTGPKLLVDGQPAPAGSKRGEMLLRSPDGKDVTVAWKPQALGFDVPQLLVNGAVINVVKPLPPYVWIWSALPLVLIVGGLLGGLSGAVATLINIRVFRTSMPMLAKFVVTALIGIAALVVYSVLASALLSATGR